MEKCSIQIDIDKHEYDNSSENTDDNSSRRADYNSSPHTDDDASQSAEDNSSQSADDDDDDTQQTEVSHVQLPTVGEKYHVNHDENWLTDQRMCHTMKTARNYCCRKQQICHEKTI